MKQATSTIHYTEALELIQDIQAMKDNLGLELSDWVKFGDEVIGMVCDLFDIEEPYVGSMRAAAIKEVKHQTAEQEKFGVMQGGITTLRRLFNISDKEVK